MPHTTVSHPLPHIPQLHIQLYLRVLEYSTTDLACLLAEGLPQSGAAATLTALRVRLGPSHAPDATRAVVAAACDHAVHDLLLWDGAVGRDGVAQAGALRRAGAVSVLRAMVVDGGATAGEVHRWVRGGLKGPCGLEGPCGSVNELFVLVKQRCVLEK